MNETNIKEQASMKLQLRDIVNSRQAVQNLSRQPLSPRLAFTLAKITRYVEEQARDYEAARRPLLERYYQPVGDGTVWEPRKKKLDDGSEVIDADLLQEFNRENGELLETEIEFPYGVIKLEHLGEGVQVTAEDMAALMWLFEE